MAASILAIIGGMILLRTWITSCCKARGLKLPPGPRSWPIVGCLPFLPKVFPRELLLAKLAEMHGELMMMRMGARTTVVVSSARMAKEFLKTHDHVFANRPNPIAFQYIGFHDTGLSSMSNTSPLFRPTRRMFATDIVSPRKVATTAHVRREQLLKMLRAIVQNLQHVNVSTAVSSLAMNLALCMNFGKDYDAHDTEILIRTFRKVRGAIQRMHHPFSRNQTLNTSFVRCADVGTRPAKEHQRFISRPSKIRFARHRGWIEGSGGSTAPEYHSSS